MTPASAGWLEAFRDFVTVYRTSHPIMVASAPEQSGQQAILATHLSTWIHDAAARLPETHVIALTTSDIGIAVAQEVLARHDPLAASLRPRVIPVRELEYRLWTKGHPDPERSLHVNHWSWIKAPVPSQRHPEFSDWPLRPGEAYWLHRVGTSGPGPTESRHAHLWKWTGSHPVLLKPFITDVRPLRTS